MNIPSEAKQKWTSLSQHGDIASICEETGYSRPVITKALEENECTMEVFTAIQEFYNKRQEAVNKLMNPENSTNNFPS